MSAHGVEVVSLGPGQTVDTGDQVSSPALLAIAVAGAVVAVALLALVV